MLASDWVNLILPIVFLTPPPSLILIQVTVTRSMFAFATDWNFTYAKKITTYDESAFGEKKKGKGCGVVGGVVAEGVFYIYIYFIFLFLLAYSLLDPVFLSPFVVRSLSRRRPGRYAAVQIHQHVGYHEHSRVQRRTLPYRGLQRRALLYG